MKRATFVIKSLTPRGGGAERVLAHVSSALSERGWDVSVLSFDAPGSKSFYEFDPKVHWVRLGAAPRWSRSKVQSIGWRAWRLRTYIKENDPSCLIPFMSSSAVPAALAITGTKTPLIVSEHIVLRYYDRKPTERHLLGWAFRQARAVTVITPNMLDGFRQRWPAVSYVCIPNPIRCQLKQSDLNYAEASHCRIIGAGTLEDRKNFGLLIRAFARLSPQHPNWTLAIFGEGPLKTELNALIKSLKLSGQITLPGSTSELLDEMKKSQIFAMPSKLESFGMVSLEAMSVGLPVVGLASCPGTNEVVVHARNGLLAENNEESFAGALSMLMNNRGLRENLGRRALTDATKYDVTEVGKLWEELLERLN